jgi:[Skp1-protein]-hydroxyproline N-acetylglucosaminyltransferase
MSIFVSIPSYRDSECQRTVKDLFDKADSPDSVFVGICWQYDTEGDEDKDCFVIETRPAQVRRVDIHWREARGPTYARHLAQSLWSGEEYHLQIDSHMRFVRGWDTKLIKYLSNTPNPNHSIITSYPVGYEPPNLVPGYRNAAFLVAKGFGDDGMLRLEGRLLKRCSDKLIKGCFWVSGFAFSSSDVIKQVPYDPHLPYLFFGEEMLMCARLWTHGWDFYCPGESVIYHLWSRAYRRNFREIPHPDRFVLEQRSKIRVWHIMGMPPISSKNSDETVSDDIIVDLPKYGLGSVRSMQAYSEFCGVDFQNRKINEQGTLCGLTSGDFVDPIVELVMKSQPSTKLE